MKKLFTLIITLLLATVTYSQVNLNWVVFEPELGKIDVIHPVYEVIGNDTIEYPSKWILRANPSPYGEFEYWYIRYYQNESYYPNIINDTIYDEAIEFDTIGMPYYEIAIRIKFSPKVRINEVQNKNLLLYPNPVEAIVYFNGIIEEYYLYNSQLQLIEKGFNTEFIDMTDYIPGIYYLKTDKGNCKIIKM